MPTLKKGFYTGKEELSIYSGYVTGVNIITPFVSGNKAFNVLTITEDPDRDFGLIYYESPNTSRYTFAYSHSSKWFGNGRYRQLYFLEDVIINDNSLYEWFIQNFEYTPFDYLPDFSLTISNEQLLKIKGFIFSPDDDELVSAKLYTKDKKLAENIIIS